MAKRRRGWINSHHGRLFQIVCLACSELMPASSRRMCGASRSWLRKVWTVVELRVCLLVPGALEACIWSFRYLDRPVSSTVAALECHRFVIAPPSTVFRE